MKQIESLLYKSCTQKLRFLSYGVLKYFAYSDNYLISLRIHKLYDTAIFENRSIFLNKILI